MIDSTAQYLDVLRLAGFKLTPKRRSVIKLFLKEKRTMAPQDVHAKLKKVISPLGLPTIYRILEELASVGILVSVVSDDRLLSYALCLYPQKHHHHFVCRHCRKVEEVDFCGFIEATNRIERSLGCRIESHLFQVEGACASCLVRTNK